VAMGFIERATHLAEEVKRCCLGVRNGPQCDFHERPKVEKAELPVERPGERQCVPLRRVHERRQEGEARDLSKIQPR